MGLRIQVPGLSYFSINLVRELLRHTLWSSGSEFTRRVARLSFSPVAMPGMPQSGGGDSFLFCPSQIPFCT